MLESFGLFQNILLQEFCENFVALHSDFHHIIKCSDLGSKNIF